MRRRRALDRRAVASEFELERPRGIAAWRALMANVGDLERTRVASHTAARRATSSSLTAPRS